MEKLITLQRMINMSKEIEELYSNPLIGINEHSIHVENNFFFDTFGTYTKEDIGDYTQLSCYIDGIQVITLIPKEEETNE